MTYPWPVEALMGSDHYITAIGPVGDGGTAVGCRCGWFAVALGGERVLEKVRRHAEEQA